MQESPCLNTLPAVLNRIEGFTGLLARPIEITHKYARVNLVTATELVVMELFIQRIKAGNQDHRSEWEVNSLCRYWDESWDPIFNMRILLSNKEEKNE